MLLCWMLVAFTYIAIVVIVNAAAAVVAAVVAAIASTIVAGCLQCDCDYFLISTDLLPLKQ